MGIEEAIIEYGIFIIFVISLYISILSQDIFFFVI